MHLILSCTVVFLFLQSYFYNDDNFNFNYAQAKATAGNFKESEEVRQKGGKYTWMKML